MPGTNVQADPRTFWWYVRRFLLYIGLALGALIVFALFFALSIHFGFTNKITGGWIAFAVYTSVLFWVVVRQSGSRWRCGSFWAVVACLLTVHTVLFVVVLKTYPAWRGIWFWPVVVVEGGAFGGIVAWFFPDKREKPNTGEL